MKLSFYFIALIFSFHAISAPLEIRADPDGSAKLYVPCTFDSVVERCFLDTGATDSNVKYDPFKLYEGVGTKTVGGLGGAGHTMDYIIVKQVEIAGIVHKDFRLLRWPAKVDRDAFAGIDLFKDLTLKLDFSKKEFLADKSEIPSNLKKFELTTVPTGQPSMPLKVGSLSTRAIWDTGAGVTVADENFITKHPQIFKLHKEATIGDSSGKQVSIRIYKASRLVVGGKVLKDVIVYGVSFEPFVKAFGEENTFVLGYNVFSQMNWYVDLKSKKWAIY